MTKHARNLLLASTAISLLFAGQAHAADSKESIKALQAQMNALQKQLNTLQAQQKATASEQTASSSESKKEILPGVKVTVGGFIAADTVYRSKNESADTPTSWAGIPINGVNAHQSEFRGSARNSRLSLLTEGEVDKDMKLSAYVEGDFAGSGTTSNSLGTSSYVPRLRQAFAHIDRNDWGLHATVGHAWSLVTLYKKGLTPRAESLPNISDGGYVPGFNYTRNVQFRLVKDFMDKKLSVGLSVESPQTSVAGVNIPIVTTGAGANAAVDVNVTNTGNAGSMNSGANYSVDQTPDMIAKVAFDPGWGHYEVFGIGRSFHNNYGVNLNNQNSNNVVLGGGGGVGVLMPLIDKKLDFRGTFMAGQGIGRYGAAGLPDIAFDSLGGIHPLTEYAMLAGLIAKPTPTWELYLYGGFEKVLQHNEVNGTGLGYGSTDIAGNNVCRAQSSSATANTNGNCQTSSVWQITPGVWKELYSGAYGNMKVGAQYSLTRRNVFADSTGFAPHAYENVVLTSFRYSPF